jgi:hydroxymethylglutaryl-CoA lyase
MPGYPYIVHTEEGMRDGLQIESAAIPVADKIRLLDALSETGLKEIVVGSFVSPKWTPQMASIDELVRGFHPRPGVRYTYTALNERGRERARAYIPPLTERITEYSLRFDTCDVFVQRDNNRTQAQQIAGWTAQIEEARARGVTEGGIALASNAWGSNWTGEFTLERRMQALERMYRLWTEAGIKVKRVDFSDAMSWNMPHQVERQLDAVKARWPSITDFQPASAQRPRHGTRLGLCCAARTRGQRCVAPADLDRWDGRQPVLRQRTRRDDDRNGGPYAHARRKGDSRRRRSLQAHRGGVACGGDRRPSALRLCLQVRPAAAP